MAITKVKGTYDLLPCETEKWVKLEGLLREVCRLYGYKEIRTPHMESSELFHRTVGEASDMVRKETYDFKDRGDRDITLRPEGTAGVVRSFIENKIYAEKAINKLFYIGEMFRYERQQKGRYRQFRQFGVESFGSNDPAMDAEVISMACTIIRALGLKNVKVHLNSLGDQESRDRYRDALVEYFTPLKDLLCDDCKQRLIKNPLRILDCKVDKDSEAFKNAPKISNYLNDSSKKHFELVKEYLKELEIEYVVDDKLVRGLDYYTYTVFEIEAEIKDFGAQNVLGGGGRYNNLVSNLGGPETPGVGFAFGMERLLLAIEAEGLKIPISNSTDLFIIALGSEAKKKCVGLTNAMRIGGLVTEMDYLDKNLKGQFKEALKNNAKFIAIIGEDELSSGLVNVKNQETALEVKVKFEDLYSYIVGQLQQRHSCSCGHDSDKGCSCGHDSDEGCCCNH